MNFLLESCTETLISKSQDTEQYAGNLISWFKSSIGFVKLDKN